MKRRLWAVVVALCICTSGKLSLEDFVAWLDSDKQS